MAARVVDQQRCRLDDRLWLLLGLAGLLLLSWRLELVGWNEEGSADYCSFYAPVARNLLDGRGLTEGDGKAAVRYPPGFSILLAGAFGLARWTGTPERLWLQAMTLVALGLAMLCIWGLGRLILGPSGATVAALLWMTYPFNLWLARQPNSEIPFLPLLYGGVHLYARMMWAGSRHWGIQLGAGLLLGCAALVRPIGLLASPTLAILSLALPWQVSRRRRYGSVALMVIGMTLTTVPWGVWVRGRTGKWVPFTTGADWTMRDGLTCGLGPKGYQQGVWVPPGARRIMEEVDARRTQLRGLDRIAAFLARKVVEHPSEMAQLVAWKAVRVWYGTDAQGRVEMVIALIQLPYLLTIASGGYLLWRRPGSRRAWVMVSGVLLLYFWAAAVAFLPLLRYMVPAIGPMFVWQAAFLQCAGRRWRERGEPSAGAA